MRGAWWVVAVALGMQANLARADSSINPDITAAISQMWVSVGALNQNYKEFNDRLVPSLPSILDSEAGSIPMLQAGMGILKADFFAELQVSMAYGATSYTGFVELPGPVFNPYAGSTNNFIFSAQGRFGIPFHVSPRVVLVPYAEAGEHLWRRDIGYIEDYSHLHVGLGGRAIVRLSAGMVFMAGAGFGSTLLSSMMLEGKEFELGSEPYHHGMLAIDVKLRDRWHLRLTTEYRDWSYEQSPRVVVGGPFGSVPRVEPRSDTRQATYLLSLGYSFAR